MPEIDKIGNVRIVTHANNSSNWLNVNSETAGYNYDRKIAFQLFQGFDFFYF